MSGFWNHFVGFRLNKNFNGRGQNQFGTVLKNNSPFLYCYLNRHLKSLEKNVSVKFLMGQPQPTVSRIQLCQHTVFPWFRALSIFEVLIGVFKRAGELTETCQNVRLAVFS